MGHDQEEIETDPDHAERRVPLSLTIRPVLKDRLERMAAQENNSVSRIVERLLRDHLPGDEG